MSAEHTAHLMVTGVQSMLPNPARQQMLRHMQLLHGRLNNVHMYGHFCVSGMPSAMTAAL